ncbi:hypothetical protein I5Q34_07485 [Streptomyces sp. AV19]|uniref:DUF6668 family protein n=1 Tax=Streptomyces sp. AV19 TaxID=2793068 RepID=UPI0018FF0561|nr:DUF6668 family protein [Streptomyces sp. AV19]MBH1934138.1 hypothetical protein [Streptomyces sp. AV19]MDG4537140.1 hypothetical protein [Streptomyces sp. AV19]
MTGPSAPQPGAVPPPSGGLPVLPWPHDPGTGWWWLGCHGGAGVSMLTQAVPGGLDANRAWPQLPGHAPARVVLVARTSFHGLTAAQQAARQWAAGAVPGAVLLGLVLVADTPGRLPRPLRDLHHLVTGGVPRTWDVPWWEAWRCGAGAGASLPKQLAALGADLSRLIGDHGVPV